MVELPEGVRVVSRLTESDPAASPPASRWSSVVVPLHQDADGNEVVTYAFAPTPASASASAAATAAESDRVGS